MAVWNPWHGCKKISAGCDICYVYEKDAMYGKNASVIRRTANFDLPVKKNRRCIRPPLSHPDKPP